MTTLDAKRIAEIRAFARAESPSGRDGVVLGHRELIALCDLAERGLAADQAIIDERRAGNAGAWGVEMRIGKILATNENGKG